MDSDCTGVTSSTDLKLTSSNFEVQEEILVKAYASGFSIIEVPFTYFPRGAGRSHAKLFSFGWKIFRSSLSLWKIRNSLASADYDERAFYSMIPPQRYWQRRRHRIAVLWARGGRPRARRWMRIQLDRAEH